MDRRCGSARQEVDAADVEARLDARQEALGQVHRVRDAHDDERRVAARRPLEEVVDDGLARGDEIVQFVEDEDHLREGRRGEREGSMRVGRGGVSRADQPPAASSTMVLERGCREPSHLLRAALAQLLGWLAKGRRTSRRHGKALLEQLESAIGLDGLAGESLPQ